MTGNQQTPEQAAQDYADEKGYEGYYGDPEIKDAFLAGFAFAHRWTPCLPETMPEEDKPIQFVHEGKVWEGYRTLIYFKRSVDKFPYLFEEVSHWRYLNTTQPTEPGK